ncbi:major capsid protein [Rhodococcus erythropolis]|uniref:major capsid protein n=1 Tax=Rhodococcus erythropolis TaxID=1833 RepID=UPI0037B928B5
MGILLPKLDAQNQSVTVKFLMNNPSWLRAALDKLIDGNEILSTFFTPTNQPVVGGGILHTVTRPEDRYSADDVVERAPGDEYAYVRGVDPEARLALVRDWGGRFDVTDEEEKRNMLSYVDSQLRQLANTLTRKVNLAALAAVDDALTETPGGSALVGASDWSNFLVVGPAEQITPNSSRPAADWVHAQLEADQERLGIVYDTLVVAPQQAADLRVGYGDQLTAVLTSAGLTLTTLTHLSNGTAYLLKKGAAGRVGFEYPLTTDVIDKRENRKKIVQAYAVPAFAVDQPRAVKKIVGLAS